VRAEPKCEVRAELKSEVGEELKTGSGREDIRWYAGFVNESSYQLKDLESHLEHSRDSGKEVQNAVDVRRQLLGEMLRPLLHLLFRLREDLFIQSILKLHTMSRIKHTW
jgi:hypothetical protein